MNSRHTIRKPHKHKKSATRNCHRTSLVQSCALFSQRPSNNIAIVTILTRNRKLLSIHPTSMFHCVILTQVMLIEVSFPRYRSLQFYIGIIPMIHRQIRTKLRSHLLLIIFSTYFYHLDAKDSSIAFIILTHPRTDLHKIHQTIWMKIIRRYIQPRTDLRKIHPLIFSTVKATTVSARLDATALP